MSSLFESTQSVGVLANDSYYELVFTLVLRCTSQSIREIPASLTSPGEPGDAPEFEPEEFAIGGILFLWRDFRAIVGEKIADELYENAVQEAIESGDF